MHVLLQFKKHFLRPLHYLWASFWRHTKTMCVMLYSFSFLAWLLLFMIYYNGITVSFGRVLRDKDLCETLIIRVQLKYFSHNDNKFLSSTLSSCRDKNYISYISANSISSEFVSKVCFVKKQGCCFCRFFSFLCLRSSVKT